MKEFSIYERIWNKAREKTNPLFGKLRQKRLNNKDFTIISNNCWAGVCYEYFNLKKRTPTAGTYFYADDYIKFISNLRYYLSLEIEMICCSESKHRQEMEQRGESNIPVGRLDDVEIVFLHYKDPMIAKEKWERRRLRVNWNNMILKFSYMNGCDDSHILRFEKLNCKKFAITAKKFSEYNDCFLATYAVDKGQIVNDTFYFDKDVDIIKIINDKITPYKE